MLFFGVAAVSTNGRKMLCGPVVGVRKIIKLKVEECLEQDRIWYIGVSVCALDFADLKPKSEYGVPH